MTDSTILEIETNSKLIAACLSDFCTFTIRGEEKEKIIEKAERHCKESGHEMKILVSEIMTMRKGNNP